jgi:predicted Zn-dependent peptidase
MTNRMLRALSTVVALTLFGCGGGPEHQTPKAAPVDLLGSLERRVLPNGLAIIIKEDHRLPTLTAMLAYRVGSVNEPEGLTGVSHFFEHMVFKAARATSGATSTSSRTAAAARTTPIPRMT